MSAYPDPAETTPSITLKELSENFYTLELEKKEHKIVGRILIKRGAGKISFVKISDGTEDFQVVLQADILGAEKWKFSKNFLIWGTLQIFEELYLPLKKVKNLFWYLIFKMAGKTLLPMPEKWHGLTDVEEKYRKRYLDILSDKNTFERFKIRAKIISENQKNFRWKRFFGGRNSYFTKSSLWGNGWNFETFHNDYGMDMVLRISLEAEHKMIMAGGYPAVYEFGKTFRNEGSDSTHMQEFTMIEWYKAYEGLEYNMNLTEEMLKNIAEKVVGKTEFEMTSAAGDLVKIEFW